MDKVEFSELIETHSEIFETSILSILFNESTFHEISSSLELTEYKEGDTLFLQGDPSDGLRIMVSGIVHLLNGENHQVIGSVEPYRSINTYSSIRYEKHSYSAKFGVDSTVLTVPNTVLKSCEEIRPSSIAYLKALTESADARSIAKFIEKLGCSLQFRVEFIAGLEEREFLPHSILSSPDSLGVESIYLLDGMSVFESRNRKSAKVSQWAAPNRTWLLWALLSKQQKNESLLRTVSKTRALILSQPQFQSMKNNFPDDLMIFERSITQGIEDDGQIDESSSEIDLDELFRDTVKSNIPFWQSYPLVLQSDQMDCGPACLSMISKSYGKSITHQYWRNQLSTDRSGTSLFDLAQTVEKNGFVSTAIEVDDIRDVDPTYLPCVALREYHFVVVYKVLKNSIIIGDPGSGIRRLPIDEFHQGFEHAVLLLKPTSEFENLPEQKTKYFHFLKLFSEVKMEMGLSFLVSILMILVGIGTPILSQIFIDDVLVRKDIEWMWLTFACGFAIAASQAGLSWAKVYYSNFISTKIDYKLNSILLKKVLSLTYKYHSEKHVGDFTARFQDLRSLKRYMVSTGEDIVLALLSVIIYSSILFMYAPIVAAATFASLPCFILISWLAGKKLVKIDQEIFRTTADTQSTLTDIIKGVASVKTLGGELASRWRFEEKLISRLKLEKQYDLNSEAANVVFDLYFTIVKYSIAGLSMYLAISGNLSAGQVLAITMISFKLFDPLVHLTDQFGSFQHIVAILDRINDLLMQRSEGEARRGQVKLASLRGEIEFKDVWFRYGTESSDWVLKGVNFKIEPGQRVAVVGPSGSGKSTIAALLTRMLEPSKGQIFIDGQDYLNFDTAWLREQIGILHQDTTLFAGTIMENIAFSEPEFDTLRVTKAAEKANAHEFIAEKINGYDYRLAHGGLGLSGGERQKIALARIFYREPQVLLLDEATSALDGASEAQLLKNLTNPDEKLTVVNIAHRFSTAVSCELALVVSKGRVVGFGSHEDLACNNEVYQSLFGDYYRDTLVPVELDKAV